MTALSAYQRLEATGIWHAAPNEQRRDVILSLGEATLTITTSAGAALSHWSLPALERLNPGEDPAMYAPGSASSEVLEVSDEAMVAALEKVRKSAARRRPKPGRLRLHVLLAALVILLGLLVIWLPPTLRRQTAALLPEAVRAEIGTALLAKITRFAGSPCQSEFGSLALTRLEERLLPQVSPARIVILPQSPRPSVALPGGLIVIGAQAVEDFDSPDVVAGHVLAEQLQGELSDPMLDFLDRASLMTSVRLMVSGHADGAALAAHAEALMLERTPLIDQALLARRLHDAGIPATPLAEALDPEGTSLVALRAADTNAPPVRREILSDGDFVALQAICDGR